MGSCSNFELEIVGVVYICFNIVFFFNGEVFEVRVGNVWCWVVGINSFDFNVG